ncbi:MAG: response regulator [Actinomycetota bacterium]
MRLESLYRGIVETSQDGIWVIDAEGRTIYANPRVAELLGRDPEELDGLTVYDALDDDGKEQFTDHLVELSQGVVHPEEVECLWVRKDGGQLWVLVRESTLYDEHGNVQGYLHRISDYTERRRVHEELISSRSQLSDAQRIARVGSYEWDMVHDVVTASDELHSIYGVSREDFRGTLEHFLEFLTPEDRLRVADVVSAAFEGKESVFDMVLRIDRPDGGRRWLRGRGEVLRNAAGDPVLLRGTQQDITETKRSELALQDLVLQNTLMQEMAIAANEAETLTEVLGVAKSLLLSHDGWKRGQAFFPDPDRPGELRWLRLHGGADSIDAAADAEERALLESEVEFARRALADGGQVWDHEHDPECPRIAFPIKIRDEVIAVTVITADRTWHRTDTVRRMVDQIAVQLGRVAERERAAHELAAARDAAMEASRQKSEFLATMSHEIRTPLNGVIGLNELLLRTDLDPHQQRLASGAQVASRALLSVINDILDFSKIEAGKLEVENVEFEVRPVFDQVASVLGESARSKGLELIVSCHPDVPEFLVGDPTRLAQVLTNLGSNAVKFTEHGEVFIRATAAPCADSTSILRVEVVDTGIGVDPEKQAHIFDPFSQADASTTRQYGGTGLGLAIAREIVSAFDGEIGVESRPGHGATFWFTVRFGCAGGPAADHDELRRRKALAGRRVLVVDDNANNRLILSEHLGRWDVRTTTAPGALRALEALRSAAEAGEAFDAVLLDMAMPDYDGLQLAAMIQDDERLRGVPLVMLTSSGQPDQVRLAQAGIVECLTKPLLAGEVLSSLLRVLEGEAPAVRRTPVPGPRLAADPDRPRLLVVEDNPVNQLVALGILETLGYAADTADDGVQAVEAWRRGGYAALLMDVQMPNMDGYAATRTIRGLEAEGERVPVLAMTAAAVEGEREKCLAAGMDDFLTKPVNPEMLGRMLRRWVDGSSEPTEPAAEQPVAEGVLDHDRLDMLRDLDPGNTAYLDKAIGNFVARVPESVHAIRASIATQDAEALTHSAHRLKGSALNLGLPTVGHLAHELEMLGDSGSTTGAAAQLEALEQALSHAVAEMLAYQQDYQRV